MTKKPTKKEIARRNKLLENDFALMNSLANAMGFDVRIVSNDQSIKSILSKCCNAPLIQKLSNKICSVCRTIVSEGNEKKKKWRG